MPVETGEPSGGAAGFQRLCYTLMTTVCSNNEARLACSFRFHTNVGLILLPQTEGITSEEFLQSKLLFCSGQLPIIYPASF